MFTLINIMLDIAIPDGAFIRPSREGKPATICRS